MTHYMFTKVWVKVLVSFSIMAFLVWYVDLNEVVRTLQNYRLTTVLIVIILQVLLVGVAALRWMIFLPGHRFSCVLAYTFIGQLYALVMPGQIAGEAAKIVRVARGIRTNVAYVGTSVMLDKVLGLLGLLLATGIGLLYSLTLPAPFNVLTGLVFILCTGIVMAIITNRKFFDWFARRVRIVLAWAPYRVSILKFFDETVSVVRRTQTTPVSYLYSLALALLYQFGAVLCTFILARELSIQIPLVDWLWIFGFVSLAVVFPVTIAGLGIREGTFIALLAQYGVSTELALVLSLSILGLQILVALIGACIDLWLSWLEAIRQYVTPCP